MNFYEVQTRNKWRTIFLIVIFTVILTFLGYMLDFYIFHDKFPYMTIIAIIIGSSQSVLGYFYGDKMVLNSVHARKPDPTQIKEKQLVDTVDEMAIAAGLPTPKVYIMDDPAPNAFATGRDPAHASVCATTGLLKLLSRDELQGVIGHEVTHIRHRDILTMTMVAALAGAIAILAAIARGAMYFGSGGGDDDDNRGGGNIVLFIVFILLAIFVPIITNLLALAVSRSREYAADAGSAELTRNPLALASALRKIAEGPKMKKVNQGVAHLFIADPHKKRLGEKDSLWADIFSTHPPISKRINILEQMAHKYA